MLNAGAQKLGDTLTKTRTEINQQTFGPISFHHFVSFVEAKHYMMMCSTRTDRFMHNGVTFGNDKLI